VVVSDISNHRGTENRDGTEKSWFELGRE